MKYEIINPSDKCYISADDRRLAMIACTVLGDGWYGLRDETGEVVLYPLQPLDEAIGMTEGEITRFIDDHKAELSLVFGSFEYADGQTSLNNIGERARSFCRALEGRPPLTCDPVTRRPVFTA